MCLESYFPLTTEVGGKCGKHAIDVRPFQPWSLGTWPTIEKMAMAADNGIDAGKGYSVPTTDGGGRRAVSEGETTTRDV